MKILVCSDIHGNDIAFKKILDFFHQEQLDEMIVLGDIFSTIFIGSVADIELSKMLFSLAGKIHFVKGNCDSKKTSDYLPTYLPDTYETKIGNMSIFASHGNRYYPTSNYNIVLQGHTHVFKLQKENGTWLLNPGSPSRSRDFSKGSFMVLTETTATIFDLNYCVLDEVSFY